MTKMNDADRPIEDPVPDVNQEKTTPSDWDKFWSAAGPFIQPISGALISAVERSNRHTGRLTACLLGLIVVCFTGLAVFSMYLGHVDTSEKIIIALVSFLGGAQMFSGPPKK